ncbi:hypothetical protein L3Q82_015337 [Scortum barcoo]|uniref:Uncharacterized protein n=1 Tax=Scortum barcoo TaxID=214431 RepID=A0ACB8VTU0_9TELE|nr:hypothetical protein L3Q82_015337 [Scortum barcoo]
MFSFKETGEHRRAAKTRRTLHQENFYNRGRRRGLGFRGERKQAVSHSGCGAQRPGCCCRDEVQSEFIFDFHLSFYLQVCQFVVSVNGLNVLHLDYRTVSHLILTGPRTVVMEVMEETDQ